MKYLEGNKINYGKLLTDEVLTVDRLLVEAAKKHMDVAGNYFFVKNVKSLCLTTSILNKLLILIQL